MASASLLARAKALVSTRSGLAGALVLTPIAAVQAEGVFTPVSSGFYTTTSGQPEYAGTYQTEIGASPLAGGAGVKLWGDTDVRSRASFSYLWDLGNGNFETRYRDGITFAWHGVFDGTLLGQGYIGEDWFDGDRLAVNYDFTIDSTYAGNVRWELLFSFNGYSGQTLASGDVQGGSGAVAVSGTGTSGNPFTWNESDDFVAATWAIHLVVKPGDSSFKYNWAPEDTLQVIVPGNSIDFGINSVPSAIPEPSTWALVLGGTCLAGVAMRRCRARQG